MNKQKSFQKNNYIGLIGLGNMGLNILKNLEDHNYKVVAWNRSIEKREKAKKETNALIVDSIEKLIENLPNQKIIISLISPGDPIDLLLFNQKNPKKNTKQNFSQGLISLLNKGDIFVDMANSYYKDSIYRSQILLKKGILMLDCGISGGVKAARNGACIMAGGNKKAFDILSTIFSDICLNQGYDYFGSAGAGHFVKMVHNSIEYGMMQSIAEGISLIDAKKDYNIDFRKLLNVWNHGSIIQSNLIGYLKKAFDQDQNEKLEKEDHEIGALGTGKWACQEALDLGIPFTSISHSVFNRYNSRFKKFIGYKAISAMRRIFGAHSGKDRA